MKRLLLYALGLVLASCEPALATTWTVTNDAQLSAANAGVQPGDVVRLAAGTYTVAIAPQRSGTAVSRIYYYGQQAAPTAVTVDAVQLPAFSTAGNRPWADYVTVKWVQAQHDIGCEETIRTDSTSYAGKDNYRVSKYDSLVKVSTINGKLHFRCRYAVFDSLTINKNDDNVVDAGIPGNTNAEGDGKNAHGVYTEDGLTNLPEDYRFLRTAGCELKNSTFNSTYTVAHGQQQFIHLVKCSYNEIHHNTFNVRYSGNNGNYWFFLEYYYGYYNNFHDNVVNCVMDVTPDATHGCIGYRDSSSFNRFWGNTITVSGAGELNLGLSQSGHVAHSTSNNYIGFNTMSFSNVTGYGGLYANNGLRADTIEFNTVRVASGPAFCTIINDSLVGAVIRHNTFITTGKTAASVNIGTNVRGGGNRMASNIFYAGGSNDTTAVVRVPSGVFAMDSAGVVFGVSGSASNAISLSGTKGAPGSGSGYGSSGKSVWGSPRLVDSTSVTNADAHLLSGSYADNASGPTHIDGYAGAYAPGAATYITITASAGANGSISPSGAVQVVQGASQAFTITPNANYAVASVTVDGVSQGAITFYTFNNVQTTHTISCTFSLVAGPYTITASAVGGATISPSGAVSVSAGASQAFTIGALTGYHLTGLSVDGSSVGTSSPYTFTNVQAPHTIVATGAINTYTITASAGANGSISPSGDTTLNYGASQAYTFTPDGGYHIASVTVDGASAGTPSTYTFTNVKANHTISVTFAADATSYTVTATQNVGGTVSPDGATTYQGGQSPTYTIVPLDGYATTDVQVDGASVGVQSLYTFTSIAADHTISATFTQPLVSYLVTTSTAHGATVSPSSSPVLVASGGSKTFTFTAPYGYNLSVYVDGVYQGPVSSHTFSNVVTNHTIYVDAVDISASDPGGSPGPALACPCHILQ